MPRAGLLYAAKARVYLAMKAILARGRRGRSFARLTSATTVALQLRRLGPQPAPESGSPALSKTGVRTCDSVSTRSCPIGPSVKTGNHGTESIMLPLPDSRGVRWGRRSKSWCLRRPHYRWQSVPHVPPPDAWRAGGRAQCQGA